MAGGIAHEINTPLAIIQSRSRRLIEIITSRNQPEQSDIILGLQKIEITSKRIANIVRGLSAFSRDSKNDPKSAISLAELFADARQLCEDKHSPSQLDLSFELLEDCMLLGRQEQLLQIIVNLVNNAFDALRELPERWVRVVGEVQNYHLTIRVIDSGCGIPATRSCSFR
jgi:C4-dicarboxylate-specific signal transduction histidine kinase